MFSNAFILLLALLLDRYIGDPDWLWRRMPHPVVWFGKAIDVLEARLWDGVHQADIQRQKGFVLIAILVGGAGFLGIILAQFLDSLWLIGSLAEVLIVGVFLAQKSLADHALAVVKGFEKNGLDGGRYAVSMIVGRDPSTLDQAGVARATIESVAENSADGIVAPALFYLFFGLPGLLAYKAINTADSMIGHKTERYLHFGFAAARLDDWANWIPARATAILTVVAALALHGLAAAKRSWHCASRDHGLHRSVNAGWPEGSFAGALDLRLGGPRIYKGDVARESYLNSAGREVATIEDIERAIRLLWAQCSVLALAILVLFVL